jgi:hypothetical protein
MNTQITSLSREQFSGSVDRDNHIIRGVSLIKTGPTKGHDMDVDETTLGQIMALFPAKGLKGKINHRDASGVLSTNGRHVNPRITRESDGSHIRTDWQLSSGRSTTPEILSLAADQPEDCGISLRCLTTKQVGSDRRNKMRVSTLMSADLVDDPAANESLLETPGTTSPESTDLSILLQAQGRIDAATGLEKVRVAREIAAQHGPAWKSRLSELASTHDVRDEDDEEKELTELEELEIAKAQLDAAFGLERVNLSRRLGNELGADWKERLVELSADIDGEPPPEGATAEETELAGMRHVKTQLDAATGVERATIWLRGNRKFGPGWESRLSKIEGQEVSPDLYRARRQLDEAQGLHKAALARQFDKKFGKGWKDKLPAPDLAQVAKIVPPAPIFTTS